MKFCQSCGMPLTEEFYGKEKNGQPTDQYCSYCYQDGAFTSQMTMEEMIDFCVPHMVEGNPGMSGDQAKQAMAGFFPQLARWKK